MKYIFKKMFVFFIESSISKLLRVTCFILGDSMVLHTFDALKSRNFSIYMAGQSVALTGMWMQKLATSWLVYRMTSSPFMLGLVELLSNAPIFIVGLFAGAWLEKHNIRKLIIAMQLLTLLHAAIAAYLLYTNKIELWHIFLLSFYLGVVFSIDMPARQASLILMVNKNSDLKSAIALHSVVFNLSRLIGPAIAGYIIYLAGEKLCFTIAALSYMPVIIALFIIKFKERNYQAFENKSMVSEIVEVIRYAKNVYYMRHMFAFFIIVGLFSYSYIVMLPIFAKDVLLGTSKILGYLQGFFGAGAMIGAFVVATFISLRKLSNFILISILIHSISMIIFALSTNIHFSLILMIPAGFGLVSGLIATNIYLQSVSDNKRGRLASLYSIVIYGLGPLGGFFAGIVTETLSPQATVIIWSVLMIISGIIYGIHLKKMNYELKTVWDDFEKE